MTHRGHRLRATIVALSATSLVLALGLFAQPVAAVATSITRTPSVRPLTTTLSVDSTGPTADGAVRRTTANPVRPVGDVAARPFAGVSTSIAVTSVAQPGISAPADVVVGEGDGHVDLVVSLSAPGLSPVSVNYATANSSAAGNTVCNFDYVPVSGTLNFAVGETTKVVRVDLLDCAIVKGFVSFTLGLSTPVNATIARASGRVGIVNNRTVVATPSLFVRDAVADETAGSVRIPVLLGGPSGQASASTVTVNYATSDAGAVAGTDYTASSGTLSFAPGETVKNVVVDITDDSDSTRPPIERFALSLSSPSNATIADGTGIVVIGANNDLTPVAQPGIAAPADVIVGEGDGYVDLVVSLSAPGLSPVSVNYATANSSAAGNTVCNFDYVPVSGTLNFAVGETTKVVRVDLLDCPVNDGSKTFTLGLSTPVNATIARATALVTIVETSPVDTAIVDSIAPSNGPPPGGTTVTITGLFFTGATAVHFGGTAAASFTFVSDTQISAVSPAGAGTVDVTVTTPNGTSATSSADLFTYVPSCRTASSVPATGIASSTNQYSLHNSDGATWQEIDPGNVRLSCTATATQSTLLTANADLFTGNAGYNQDLGIFVSDNGGADQLLAWKESGGFAGTFSPNAAYVQSLYNLSSGHSYVFKLKWKANKNAPGATIYAGAGSGPYSPTTLVAETFPTGVVPKFAVSTTQYTLPSSDGVTWQTIDAAHLSTTVSPAATATAVLGGNVDLWTANAGYNQDIGIFVSDNGGADSLVAWKEAGGFAGTFSPNAAFVKATYAMTASHTYVFTLKWKTNKPAPGVTIVAAAGSGPVFSPTSLLAESIAAGANPYTAVSTSQYSLSNSNGVTWQSIDAALNVSVTPGADTFSVIGANADLFTANAGYNQDIGIFVSDNGGIDTLVAWKESGGFAGTFSPNAAFAQATYQMTAGHTYVFKLKWKTNKPASGATIYAAAGGPAPFSPTRLTVELTS